MLSDNNNNSQSLTIIELSELTNHPTITDELISVGILGFLIIDSGGLPFFMRGYANNGVIDVDNPFLLTGFISAINSYARGINGVLTDIGLGFLRLALKQSPQGHVFCLFLSEIVNRRSKDGEEFSMVVELTLAQLMKSFYAIFSSSEMMRGGVFIKDEFNGFEGLVDQILLKSFTMNQRLVRDENW